VTQLTIRSVLLLDETLENLVDLGTVAHGLCKRRGTDGQDHVLLESKTVASVLAAVDDVERGDRELEFALVAGEVGNVAVKRDALRYNSRTGEDLVKQEMPSWRRPSRRRRHEQQRAKQRGWRWLRACLSVLDETSIPFSLRMEISNKAKAANLPLFLVPSRSIMNLSTAAWSLRSMLALMKAGAITLLTLATALVTPNRPINFRSLA
jgi:hypothetical protein